MRADITQALADLDAAAAHLRSLLADPPQPPSPVRVEATEVTSTAITVRWSTDVEPASWTVGRNNTDTLNTGPWTTDPPLPGSAREQRFGLLRPATPYRITLTPQGGQPVEITVTTKAATVPGPVPTPGAAHGPRALADGWVPLLRASDDFNGAAVDDTQWSRYSSLGHGGRGLRRPGQFSIVDDPTAIGGRALRVVGTPDGTTGGMAHKAGQKFGRWGARMRVPAGDSRYHPVLLTWSHDEKRFPWPNGGEIDFAEGKCGVGRMEFFLHYSKDNRQTSGAVDVDVTQWHWYELQWAPDGVWGWCDGRLFFEDRDRSHFNYAGFDQHHGTIQLDWFPGDGVTRTGGGEMLVDAYRVYRHPETR